MHNINAVVKFCPIPYYMEALNEDYNDNSYERHVNNVGELWYLLMHFWPSSLVPPYPMNSAWIWVWQKENDDIIWELASVL